MGTMVGNDSMGNQIGVAPGAKWIGCRNMENGYGRPSTYLECFEWFLAPYALDSLSTTGDPTKMPHVINNSWGCPPAEGCDTSVFHIMKLAVDHLKLAGCVVVVSAGNSGSACGTVNDPSAIFENSFSIGATNSSDEIAGFSSRGPVTVDGSNRIKPNVSAPGVSVRSAIRNNGYGSSSGTSMAGPHVAGLVALLISANPTLAGEVDKIEDIIEQTAVNLTSNNQSCNGIPGTSIPNNTYGYGRIDAVAAINMALPKNYEPYVKQSESVVIKNPSAGLILTDASNQLYRINVNNSGQVQITITGSQLPNSMVVSNGSLNFENNFATFILRSPDNSYWGINISDLGEWSTMIISSLPPHIEITSGDVIISTPIKGVVLRSPNNTCFLTNISKLGKILTIPAVCTH
jgi:subtilisin family serine protease